MRGRTTQNFVSSTRKFSVFGAICAVAMTLPVIVREADRLQRADVDAVVVDLGLAGLEPLGRVEDDRDLRPLAHDPGDGHPGADERRRRSGTIQTRESRVCFLGHGPRLGHEAGRSDQAWRGLAPRDRIPDQPRIEGLDREHRQHHDRREEEQAGRRPHRHERLQLHERRGEGVDEDVDHRPAADQLDHAVEPHALRRCWRSSRAAR